MFGVVVWWIWRSQLRSLGVEAATKLQFTRLQRDPCPMVSVHEPSAGVCAAL